MGPTNHFSHRGPQNVVVALLYDLEKKLPQWLKLTKYLPIYI